MRKISNAVVGVLNSLTLLLSLPVIGAALWLSLRAAASSECGRLLHLPLLAVGAALFVTSLLGLVGSFFRVSGFLWAYLAVLSLVIVAALAFAVMALVVTNRGIGRALSGKGYEEYRLGHYSHWLRRWVHEWKNWKVIASCLKEGKFCRRGSIFAGIMAGLFFRQNLAPMQSGCCKPPKYCKFKNMNNATWTIPDSATASSAPDCLAWSNDLHELCYSCSSCKAGVVAVLRRGWKKLIIANLVLLIVVIVIYSLSCCALSNNRRRRHVTGAHT
ncbi:tetraspanin-8-like [Curcuma longa]|uniref:tetraspanin-8-like n=1 Tax=Curcuma longa TaxID=136217 RepID=UPI003D9E1E2F